MAACHGSRRAAPPACAMDFSRSARTMKFAAHCNCCARSAPRLAAIRREIEVTCGTANLPDFKGRDATDWVADTAALGAQRVLVPLGYMNLSYDRDGLTKGLGAIAKALGL